MYKMLIGMLTCRDDTCVDMCFNEGTYVCVLSHVWREHSRKGWWRRFRFFRTNMVYFNQCSLVFHFLLLISQDAKIRIMVGWGNEGVTSLQDPPHLCSLFWDPSVGLFRDAAVLLTQSFKLISFVVNTHNNGLCYSFSTHTCHQICASWTPLTGFFHPFLSC